MIASSTINRHTFNSFPATSSFCAGSRDGISMPILLFTKRPFFVSRHCSFKCFYNPPPPTFQLRFEILWYNRVVRYCLNVIRCLARKAP